MIFRNSTPWPDHFVRAMLTWCIKHVDIPRRPGRRGALLSATFRKRNTAHWSGYARPGRIVVSVNPGRLEDYPMKHNGYKRACRPADGGDYPTLRNPLDVLVMVTAHELGHVAHFRQGHYGRDSEARADARARYVYRLFQERRAELLMEWNRAELLRVAADTEATLCPPAAAEPATNTLQQRRAAKAQAMLDKWERRLKLAERKAAKYRRRVAYYERKAAQ